MNIFVEELLSVLRKHGRDLSYLTTSVGIHFQVVNRLKVSLSKENRSAVLNPDDLDALQRAIPLNEDEMYRLQAAVMAESVRRVQLERVAADKATGLAKTTFQLILDHWLASQPIEYYACFISYSHKDQPFALLLYTDLQSKGVRCWFAPEDLKIGDKLRPHIDESIRLYDKLLLVLSQHSVTSQWVEQEVETALEKERKKQQTVLFPIRLDNTVMNMENGWPALVRNTRHIGDFTRWTDSQVYQQAFERLLYDLKAENAKEGR